MQRRKAWPDQLHVRVISGNVICPLRVANPCFFAAIVLFFFFFFFFFFFNRSLFLNSFILQSVCTRTRGIKLYPVNHWTALSNSIWAPLSLVNPCSIPLSRFQPFFRHICFFHSSFLPFYLSLSLSLFIFIAFSFSSSTRKVLATNWPIQWILLNDSLWFTLVQFLSPSLYLIFISLSLSLSLFHTLTLTLFRYYRYKD